MRTSHFTGGATLSTQAQRDLDRPAPAHAAGGFHPAEGMLMLLAVAVFLSVCVIGFAQNVVDDVGLAYQGGQVAWQTGHPEQLATWISSPFLALVMALLSRVIGVDQLAVIFTGLNELLFGAAVAYIWWRLRPLVSRTGWWVTLLATVAFAPIASTIFWKQFNLIALVLAAAGFALVGRRNRTAGLLIALSLGIKPLVLLLPVALLWKRESRRAGIWSLIWGAALLAVSQAFLAWRAHDWHALSPLPLLHSFTYKSLPYTTGWIHIGENYALMGLVARLTGGDHWSLKRDVLLVAIALLILVAADLLRNRTGRSWMIFAMACAISPLLSPLAWSHYQILLAPLLIVLAYEFWREGAGLVEWAALAVGYALCELTLRPFGTLPGLLHAWLTGYPESTRLMNEVFAVAQFGQYFVLVAAFLWLVWRKAMQTAPARQAITSANPA